MELLELQLAITVNIDPSNDGGKLEASGYMAHLHKEALQVRVINVLIKPIVNRVEGTTHSEIIALLKISL